MNKTHNSKLFILFGVISMLFVPPMATAETGIIMFNEGSSSDIYWSTFTDSAIDATENALSVTNDEYWIDCEASSVDGDRILCGAGSDGSGNLLTFEYDATANTMTAKTTVTSDLPALSTATFDISCEQTTGDCLIAYIEDTSNDIGYRTWNVADSDWSAESKLSTTDDDNGYWIRLAFDPGSDDILMGLEEDTGAGATLTTRVWDGSSWGSATDHGSLSLNDGVKLTQDFDLAWVGDTGTAMVVYGEDSAGGNSLVSKTWTSGGGWTGTTDIIASMNNNLKQVMVQLATDISGQHDEVALCQVQGNAKLLTCHDYSGSWSAGSNSDQAETGKGGRGNVGLAFEYGTDGDAYVGISGKSADFRARVYDQSAGTWGTAFGVVTDASQKGTVNVAANPNSNAMAMSYEDGKNLDDQWIVVCDDIGTACSAAGGWSSATQLRTDAVTSVNNVHDLAFLDGTVTSGPSYSIDLLDVYESSSSTLDSGTAVCTNIDLSLGSQLCGGLKDNTDYRFEIEVSNSGSAGSPNSFSLDDAHGSATNKYLSTATLVGGDIVDYGCGANADWTGLTIATNDLDVGVGAGTTCSIATSGSVEYWIVVNTGSLTDDDDSLNDFSITDGTDSTVDIGDVDFYAGVPTYVVDLLDVYQSSSTTLDSGTAVCLDVDLESASTCNGSLVSGTDYRLEIEIDNTGAHSGSPNVFNLQSFVGASDVFGSITNPDIIDYGCSTNTDWTAGVVSGTDVDLLVGAGTLCSIPASGSIEFWVIINPDATNYAQTGTFDISGGGASDSSTTTTFDDTTLPTVLSGQTLASNIIELTMSEPITSTAATADFTVNGIGTNTISTVVGAGDKLTITLATGGASLGDTITVDYTRVTGTVIDAATNILANFSAQPVTNNVDAWCDISATVCDDTWGFRKKITINSAEVEGTVNLRNFPFLVNFTGSDFTDVEDETQSLGQDIRFTDHVGNILQWEIEQYDETANKMAIWVKSNSTGISPSVDTDLFMYYGHATATNISNATDVWQADYVMVQHLEETTGTHLDSTSNNNDGTNDASTQDSVGKVAGANEFDGGTQVVDINYSAEMALSSMGEFYVSAWVNADVLTAANHAYPTVFAQGNWDVGLGLTDSNGGTAGTDGRVENWIDDSTSAQSTNPITVSTWTHIGLSQGASADRFLYINGVQDGSGTFDNPTDQTTAFAIGNIVTPTVASGFDGLIDEVRVYDVIPTADWILTEYNTINTPDIFIGVSVEETAPDGAAPVYVVDLLDVYESESTTLGSGNVVCLDVDLEIADECEGHLIVGHTYRFEVEVDETAGNTGSPTTIDIDSSVADYDVLGNILTGHIIDSGCFTNTNWSESIVSTDARATSGTTCALLSSTAEYWIIIRINSDAGSGAKPTATFTIDDGSVSDVSTTTTFTVDTG